MISKVQLFAARGPACFSQVRFNFNNSTRNDLNIFHIFDLGLANFLPESHSLQKKKSCRGKTASQTGRDLLESLEFYDKIPTYLLGL